MDALAGTLLLAGIVFALSLLGVSVKVGGAELVNVDTASGRSPPKGSPLPPPITAVTIGILTAMTDATRELARLDNERSRAGARVEELEAERRSVAEAVRQAAAGVAAHERQGGRPAERRQLEAALAEARRVTENPALVARLEGARARARDLNAERQRLVGEHLAELVEPVEADGRAAVEDMLAACERLVQAYHRREAAAQRVSALASTVARAQPGDVGPYSRAEAAIREATRLIEEGEPAPRLRRYPGEPAHGHVSAEVVPA